VLNTKDEVCVHESSSLSKLSQSQLSSRHVDCSGPWLPKPRGRLEAPEPSNQRCSIVRGNCLSCIQTRTATRSVFSASKHYYPSQRDRSYVHLPLLPLYTPHLLQPFSGTPAVDSVDLAGPRAVLREEGALESQTGVRVFCDST
jgi:hypothetical protein